VVRKDASRGRINLDEQLRLVPGSRKSFLDSANAGEQSRYPKCGHESKRLMDAA
jgi:hypothetical protein